MALSDRYATLRERKLVVLGIPWDVETDELKYYMRKFGELEDCIIMKDRATRQSRGFGYVTFLSIEDAKKAASAHHVLNGRVLDVKVATPREDMMASNSRTGSRIFVARIPAKVTDEMFRSYFQKYGVIADAYMPKDAVSKMHRGIGFVTFENPESVDEIMKETHELGGSALAVDRATPKEEMGKNSSKPFADQYSMYNAYMAAAAAAAAAFGMGEGFDFTTAAGFLGALGVGPENLGVPTSEGQIGDAATAIGDSNDGGSKVSPADGGSNAAYNSAQAFFAAAAAAVSAGYGSGAFENVAASVDNPLNGSYQVGSADPNHGSLTVPNAGTSSAMYGWGAAHGNEGSGYGPDAWYSGTPGYGSGDVYGSVPASTQPPVLQSGAYSADHKSSNPYAYPSAAPPDSEYYGPPSASQTLHPPEFTYGSFYNNAAAVPSSGFTYGCSAAHTDAHAQTRATHNLCGYSSGASYDSSRPATAYSTSNPYPGAVPSAVQSYAASGSGARNKIYICKLPHEATAEHLRTYFSAFGRVLDVYIPKDAKKTGHRGFGFVTFFDESVAERVAQEAHAILGQPIAVDRPIPHDIDGSSPYCGNIPSSGPVALIESQAGEQWSSYSGRKPEVSTVHWVSRTDARYKPY